MTMSDFPSTVQGASFNLKVLKCLEPGYLMDHLFPHELVWPSRLALDALLFCQLKLHNWGQEAGCFNTVFIFTLDFNCLLYFTFIVVD